MCGQSGYPIHLQATQHKLGQHVGVGVGVGVGAGVGDVLVLRVGVGVGVGGLGVHSTPPHNHSW